MKKDLEPFSGIVTRPTLMLMNMKADKVMMMFRSQFPGKELKIYDKNNLCSGYTILLYGTKEEAEREKKKFDDFLDNEYKSYKDFDIYKAIDNRLLGLIKKTIIRAKLKAFEKLTKGKSLRTLLSLNGITIETMIS